MSIYLKIVHSLPNQKPLLKEKNIQLEKERIKTEFFKNKITVFFRDPSGLLNPEKSCLLGDLFRQFLRNELAVKSLQLGVQSPQFF